MNVFMITEGGKDIGFGHITRCISLYQAFEEREIIPEFIINGDESIDGLLEDKNHRIFNWLEEKNKLFRIITNAEVVIVDSYLADISFYEGVSKSTAIPVYIDDTKRLDYPRGLVLNGSIYAEEINYPKKEGIIYVLGPKYALLRKEFWEVPEKQINEIIGNILITFGGDDARNMAPKVLKFLNKKYPHQVKNILIGKGFKNIKEMEILKDEKVNLIYYPDAETSKEIMLKSDIAISAGGQTLYELAKVGIPTVAIAVAENQVNNVIGWQKIGFVKYAGYWNDSHLFKNIDRFIKGFNNKHTRITSSDIGRTLIKGEGARLVTEIFLKRYM